MERVMRSMSSIRVNWKIVVEVAAVVGGVATVVGVVFAVLAYKRQVHSDSPPTVTASETPGVEFRGGDNNGGAVFIDNTNIIGARTLPSLRAGNGGQNGPGGPVIVSKTRIETGPAPSR
jgi:hypothetical protein